MSFKVVPGRCERIAISYMEGKRVPKNRRIVIERIRKVLI